MSFVKGLAAAVLFAMATVMPSAASNQTLTIATTFGPNAEVPDPRAGYNGWMSNQAGVTESLMGMDYNMELYPRVAESIEQVAPTTWRLTLKDGVQFHDGTAVVAQAVIDAIAPISDENDPAHNARISQLLDLAGMTADGDQVIIFETNSPNAAFPFSLSEPGVAVLGPPSDAFPINATGPYVFREAIPDQLYRASANADYRLGKPGLSEVRIVASPDPAAASLAFEAGEVDMVVNYPETDFERITSAGAQGFSAPTSRLYFYSMNTASGPLANPLIRRAVSLAIDRDGIVEAVMSGVGGVPAGTMYPAGKSWAADISPNYDPAAAEALLAESGAVKEGGRWMLDGEPLEIDIITYSSRAALPPTAELTQAFLQAIGVSASVRVGEYAASNDALAAGDADMFLQAWVMLPQGDPGAILEFLVKSDGGSNAGQYSNLELDALLDAGRTNFDPTTREDIYTQIQQIIAEDAPLVPVFHVSQVNVARAGLTGYQVHPAENYWVTYQTTFTE